MVGGSGDSDSGPPSDKQDMLETPVVNDESSAALQEKTDQDAEEAVKGFMNGVTCATVCELIKMSVDSGTQYRGNVVLENRTEMPYGFAVKSEHSFIFMKPLNHGVIPPLSKKILTFVCPDTEWKVAAVEDGGGQLRIFTVALPVPMNRLKRHQHLNAMLLKYPAVGEMHDVTLTLNSKGPSMDEKADADDATNTRTRRRPLTTRDYAWFLLASFVLFLIILGQHPVHMSILGRPEVEGENSDNSFNDFDD